MVDPTKNVSKPGDAICEVQVDSQPTVSQASIPPTHKPSQNSSPNITRNLVNAAQVAAGQCIEPSSVPMPITKSEIETVNMLIDPKVWAREVATEWEQWVSGEAPLSQFPLLERFLGGEDISAQHKLELINIGLLHPPNNLSRLQNDKMLICHLHEIFGGTYRLESAYEELNRYSDSELPAALRNIKEILNYLHSPEALAETEARFSYSDTKAPFNGIEPIVFAQDTAPPSNNGGSDRSGDIRVLSREADLLNIKIRLLRQTGNIGNGVAFLTSAGIILTRHNYKGRSVAEPLMLLTATGPGAIAVSRRFRVPYTPMVTGFYSGYDAGRLWNVWKQSGYEPTIGKQAAFVITGNAVGTAAGITAGTYVGTKLALALAMKGAVICIPGGPLASLACGVGGIVIGSFGGVAVGAGVSYLTQEGFRFVYRKIWE